MPERLKPTGEVIEMLAAMPARIATLAEGATPEQLTTPPAPGEWSAAGVIAHLRSCADVWGDAIRVIAANDPTAERPPTVPFGTSTDQSAGRLSIRAINPTTWVRATDYFEVAFGPSFAAYAEQRADLVVLLGGLAPEDWVREALVTGAGRPLTRTLHEFAQRIAIHERPHLRQIRDAIVASQRGRSGPRR